MLAQNLLRPILLDALRSSVPRDHTAFSVQHEDRVVLDALHEQPEHFLALADPFFRANKAGDVFHTVNDVCELLAGEHRSVDRTPVTFTEVLLRCHRVRLAGAENRIERCAQIIGMIGEHFEEVLADDLLTPGHGCFEIGVTDGDNPQILIEDQIKIRNRLKDRTEVRLCRHKQSRTGQCWLLRTFTCDQYQLINVERLRQNLAYPLEEFAAQSPR